MFSTATCNDAAALEHLINSAYRGESSRKGWTTEADLLDGQRTDKVALAELMTRPNTVILKQEGGDGTLQGCVCVEKQNQQLHLGMLTVAPHLQNSGLGKKLLQAAEAYAREQQCTTVEMTVISVRHELIRWYERRGFKPTGKTKPFPDSDPRFGIPKQPLEFVILTKRLD